MGVIIKAVEFESLNVRTTILYRKATHDWHTLLVSVGTSLSIKLKYTSIHYNKNFLNRLSDCYLLFAWNNLVWFVT